MKRLLSILLLAIALMGNAQVLQPARWEQESKFGDDTYTIISLKAEGLALVRSLDKFKNGKKTWEVIFLDTDLNQKWTTELELQDDLRFVGFEYTPGKVSLMFRRNDTEALKAEMFMIDLASRNIQTSKTEVKLQVRLTHYTVVDGNSVFGGYVIREPVLIIHDPVKNNNIMVPGFFLTDTELLDVRPNGNNTFNILLSQRTMGQKKIIFRTFDKLGNILVEDEIPIDEEKTILAGASSVLQHDEVLIAGAYSFNNGKQASGIFSCLIDPFSEQEVEYTEFHQLQHFFDYLSDKKASKIREKSTQRENYGKPPEFKTNIGIHRIEEFNGGFALFGESFLVSSASTTSAFSSPYYNPSRSYGYPYSFSPYSSRYYNNPYSYSPTTTVEEMRMTEGFVIGYDFKGKRLWDYAIPMEEYRTTGRDQVSDFTIRENVPHFLYKDEDKLKFSNHDTDTLELNQAMAIPIKLKNEMEEAKSNDESEGNVRHWYGSSFYVWGTQTIKSLKSKGGESSRRVFFINKVTVD